MNIFQKTLKTDCLIVDANKTLYSATMHKPPIYFRDQVIGLLNGSKRNEWRVYLAEYLAGLFSDMGIGDVKHSAHYALVRNIEKTEFKKATLNYIRNHEYPGVRDFLEFWQRPGKTSVLVSRNPFAEEAAEEYKIPHLVSNESVFEDCVYRGSRITINTAQEKLSAVEKKLEEIEVDFGNCSFVGDGRKDDLIGKKCKKEGGVYLASPDAEKFVRKNADHWIRDYRYFARNLQEEMPNVKSFRI